jgi:thioredoxin 1
VPQVEALEGKYTEKVKFTKVEAPKNRRLCIELKVMGLPTLLFYKEGKEVERLTGNNASIEKIEDSMLKLL